MLETGDRGLSTVSSRELLIEVSIGRVGCQLVVAETSAIDFKCYGRFSFIRLKGLFKQDKFILTDCLEEIICEMSSI